jgi:hypothetical protein
VPGNVNDRLVETFQHGRSTAAEGEV